MLMAERTGAADLYDQYEHPLAALIEYTDPVSVPKNTRPPTTVAWPFIVLEAGNPNAHFSLRRGTCSGASCAAAASWKRALLIPAPQPFHVGFALQSPRGGCPPQGLDKAS